MPSSDPRARRPPPAAGPSPLAVLLGLNLAVFVGLYLLIDTPWGALYAEQMVMDPQSVGSHPWTLLTAAFSHVDANHLLFNLLGLWVFGGPVQARYGGRALTVLYVVGALCASLAHLALSPSPMLGASGAVLALSVVFAMTWPQTRLLVFFVLPLPAWLAVAGFVVMDVIGLVGPGDGIAHAAHLGGAAFGALWVMLRRRREASGPSRSRWA